MSIKTPPLKWHLLNTMLVVKLATWKILNTNRSGASAATALGPTALFRHHLYGGVLATRRSQRSSSLSAGVISSHQLMLVVEDDSHFARTTSPTEYGRQDSYFRCLSALARAAWSAVITMATKQTIVCRTSDGTLILRTSWIVDGTGQSPGASKSTRRNLLWRRLGLSENEATH